MRTVGIVAVFILSLAAIGEGAALFQLSRRVESLTAALADAREHPDHPDHPLPTPAASSRPFVPGASGRAIPAQQPLPARMPLPILAAPGPSTHAAVDTLKEALSTSAGREQLKGALATIHEEERRDRMVKKGTRADERDSRDKDRILQLGALQPQEQQRVTQLYSDLQQGRRRVLEDLQAGLKTSDQADNEIDELENNVEKSWKTLLGEQRLKQYREATRAERDRNGGKKGPRGEAQPQPSPPASPPVAGAQAAAP